MTNALELKAECVRNGINVETLAKELGIDVTTMYRRINGKSEFQRDELGHIKKILNLSDEKFIAIFFGE